MSSIAIKRFIAGARPFIPRANIRRFDAEAGTFVAAAEDEPGREAELLRALAKRCERLRRLPAMTNTPHFVARKTGETNDAWINRCYDAAGYITLRRSPRPAGDDGDIPPRPTHL